MRRGFESSKAGLRPDFLVGKSLPFLLRLRGLIAYGHYPDAQKGQGHGKDGRGGIRKGRGAGRIAQGCHPHGIREHGHDQRGQQARKAPGNSPSGGAALPQYREDQAGKLAEAAMAKASDTMKATFCFSNTMPRNMAMMPRATVVSLEILSSSLELALPFLRAEA